MPSQFPRAEAPLGHVESAGVFTGPISTFYRDGSDILDVLPEPARSRLTALRDARHAAFALLAAANDRVEEARQRLMELERNASIRRANRSVLPSTLPASMVPPPRGPVDGEWQAGASVTFEPATAAPDDPRLTKAKAELTRLTALAAAEAAKSKSVRELCDNNIEIWLKQQMAKGATIVAYTGALPERRKGETVQAAVARVRRQIGDLREELERTRSAPFDIESAKQLARQQVAELAERGRPNVETLIRYGEAVALPQQPVQFETAIATEETIRFWPTRGAVPDAHALLAFMFRDALIAAVVSEIDRVAETLPAGMSQADRKRRLAELADAILSLERQEAELVWASDGPAGFRGDIDPRAALGIEVR